MQQYRLHKYIDHKVYSIDKGKYAEWIIAFKLKMMLGFIESRSSGKAPNIFGIENLGRLLTCYQAQYIFVPSLNIKISGTANSWL